MEEHHCSGRCAIATAKFYVASSIEETLFGELGDADVSYYDSTEIRIEGRGGVTLVSLSGQFNWTADGFLISGTLSGFTTYKSDGSGKAAEVSGLRIDMEKLFDLVETGSEDQVGQLFFGGADRITGSSEADSLSAYGGNDTIDGGAGNDTIDGSSGNDSIFGGDGNDLIVGGAGNDTLIGGGATDFDTLEGGSGNDTYAYGLVVEAAGGGVDLILSYGGEMRLPENVENGSVVVSTGARVVGNGLDNVLTGGSGNDTLESGDGNDSLNGGAGDDTFVILTSDAVIVESSKGGTDTVRTFIDYTMHANVENVQLQLFAGSVVGNGLSNTITGAGGNNILDGGAGNDTLYGNGGDDTLIGGDGNDLLALGRMSGPVSLIGGAGDDRYILSGWSDPIVESSGGGIDSVEYDGSYTLRGHIENLTLTGWYGFEGTGNGLANKISGNSGDNRLTGGDGHDSLFGNDGVDTLIGGNHNDRLDGGSGADSMNGGSGNDNYMVQNSGDLVVEKSGGGTDRVVSSITYTLPAEVEMLTLTGSSALEGHGNGLNNTIVGNDGANLLRGSTGNDTLTGGAGADVFRFSSAINVDNNVDIITDFNVVDDVLQLENNIFNKLAATGALSASFFRASSTGNAADSSDYVLYETDTGKLFYDADGNGSGAKLLIAQLSGNPTLSAADIFVT